MFNKKIILGLCALFTAQVSFAGGGGDCNTIQSGNWSDNATWSCDGLSIPENEDTVTIKTGHTVLLDVDTAAISSLLVEAGGDLNVMSSVNGLSINVSIASSPSNAIDLSQASIELFGDLTINADDIVIKLGVVTGQFGLTLNSTGETQLMGKIGDTSINSPTSLTTDASGTTVFDIPNGGVNSPNIIVYGPRTFNDAVLLQQYTHMSGTSGAITFNRTLDTKAAVSSQALNFSSINNVTLSFNQDVGEIKSLGSLEVFNSTGAIIEINTAQVITSGQMNLSENILLNAASRTVTLKNTDSNSFIEIGGSNKFIRSASGNSNSLIIESMGSIQINGDIGDDTFPINNVTMDATAGITINSAAISALVTETFIGDIVLSSDVIMTANGVDIVDNIDNAGFDLTLNVAPFEAVSTISGVLSGAGNFYKSGLGDLVFASQSTQTGNVILNQGKLINTSLVADLFTAAPIISLATGTTAQIGLQLGTFSAVNLQTDQMLIGSGFCDCTLNVLDGKVSPGFSSGLVANRLRINNMVMNNQSELIIQLNGTSSEGGYDQVIVDGATLTGATLNLSLGFIPDIGDTFKIIDVTGPPPVTGTFVGLSEGDTIIINGWILSISYSGGGNDVVLTVVGSTRYYVDADAVPLGDGLSWGTAFNTLQDALTVAITGAEIWVADGVYYPDDGNDNGRSSAFVLSGIDIYGGFNGTETDKTQRDLALNISVLSGDIDNNDSNGDNNFIAESSDDIQGSNAYHVLVIETDNIIIDGFIITAGQATDPVVKSQAISNLKGENPNHIGAGISAGNHNIMINNVQFVGNIANQEGAAMASCNQCQIDGSDFYANKVVNGSGGAISSANSTLSNSEFIGNHAGGSGGAILGSGVLNNVLFENNSSSGLGGAILSTSSLVLIRTKFINNSASFGGAIRSFQTLTIDNSLLLGNQSGDDGGAIYASGPMTITNSTLTGNKSSTGAGGAIYLGNTVNRTVDNSIIWNNQDSTGIGTLTASIRVDNVNLTTTNSVFQGSGGSVNWNNSASADGGNNLDADPSFILETDPTTAPTNSGNTHLMGTSIAINAGDNSLSNETLDLDGSQRIQDTTIDMGAYEFSSHVISVTVTGLDAGTLVLQNNGGDDLNFNTDDTLQFNSAVANTADYLVTVLNQPTSPNQECVITNGSGTIAGADVSVGVACTTLQYTVSGELFGLDAGDVFLLNNAGDELELSNDGIFEFVTALDDLNQFVVTVNTSPTNPSQTCVVTGGNSGLDDGTGFLAGADYSGIVVTCTTNTYSIGGNLSGLNSGQQLRLRYVDGVSLNIIEDLVLTQNNDYTFNSTITDLGEYQVKIIGQPSNQTCVLSNVSGTINGANVTNINATCHDYIYKVGGELFGLGAGSISLKNNSGDEIVLTENGVFQFPTAIADQADYSVSISVQPTNPEQTCVVTGGNSGLNNGTGTLNTADDNSIVVTCTTNQYFIGGVVSGLANGNSVLLSLGAEDLTVNSNAAFVFLNPLIDESSYNVSISSQPTVPNQACSLVNPAGTIAGNDITDIQVNCSINQYMIGGTVIGLHSGNNLIIQNNSGDDLMISSDGDFDFVTDIEDLQSYNVSILNQPSDPVQACVISNNTGNVAGSHVTTVSIVCAFGDDLIYRGGFE